MAEKILIISPVPLFPGHAGNRVRIRTICKELMDRGYVLDFFYTGYHDTLDEAHISFFNGDVFRHRVETNRVSAVNHPLDRIKELFNGFEANAHKWFRRFADGPDSARFNRSIYEYKNVGKILLLKKQAANRFYKAVIVNYAPYSFYFDLFDSTTIQIIDTHDRLTDRYRLFSESRQPAADWHSLRYNDEKQSLSKADIIWAITDEEHHNFKKMVDTERTKVFTLRHVIPYNRIETHSGKKNILMTGSGNRLNLEGLTWFLEQVWEKLKHYDKNIRFLIAGSICNAIEEKKNDERIEMVGLYESPEEIYSKGDLFINPMQEGTGLKIKTFEALASGKYVISTTAGATGLKELAGNGLFCSDNPVEWINRIVSFFNEPDQIKSELTKAGQVVSEIHRKNLETISVSLNEPVK